MMNGLFRSTSLLSIISLTLLLSIVCSICSAQQPDPFVGTVKFPGTDEPITIIQHEGPFNEHSPTIPAEALTLNGDRFQLKAAPNDQTEIEIYGPNIFRQRYPWPRTEKGPAPLASFPLLRGTTSVGTLTHNGEAITNAVLGPIAPFQENEEEVIGTIPFYITTPTNGEYHLQGMYPNTTYQVYIDAPGFEQDERLIRSGDKFEFSLQPSTTVISGILQGERSVQPLANRRVKLQSVNTAFNRTVISSAEGTYEFSRIPADDYLLIAVSPAQEIPSLNTRVSLNPDQQITELILPAYEYSRINGLVIDQETLFPIAGVEVNVGDEFAVTDSAGEFAINRYLSPWPAVPVFSHPDYEFNEKTQVDGSFPIQFSETTDISGLVFNLQKKRALHFVMDPRPVPEPLPIPSFSVRIAQTEDQISTETIIPENATAVVPIPKAGTWLVYARTQTSVSTLESVLFDAESTTKTLAIAFGPGAKVSGKFTFDLPTEAAPFPTGTLRLLRDTVPLFEATIAELGEFQLSNVPPAEYTVEFMRPDQEPWLEPFTITLKHGSTEAIVKIIQRGVDVPVVVVDEEGNPVSGVELSLYGRDHRDEQKTMVGKTGTAGDYLFSSVGHGPTTLELRHPDYRPGSQKFSAPVEEQILTVTLKKKDAIELTVATTEQLLLEGSAYLMQQTEIVLPSGERQVISNVVGMYSEHVKGVFQIIPQQEGEFSVAFGAGPNWSVSKPLTWTFSTPGEKVRLQVPSSSTLTISSPQFSATEQDNWSLELVNTSLPEDAAQTVFKSVSWKAQGANSVAVFNKLPYGIYYLIASHPTIGGKTLTGIQIFSNSESAMLEFEAGNYDLVGVLLNSSEKIVANAEIDLVSSEGGQLMDSTTSDAQGSFRFYVLDREQKYHLVVEAETERELFSLSKFPGNQITREEVFTFKKRCQYLVEFPGGEEPAYPLIFVHQGESLSLTYTGEELKSPQVFQQGDYAVFVGEDRFGKLSVPQCDESQKPRKLTIVKVPNP